MATLLGESYPKARKGHGCDGCGGSIGAGDTYVRQRVVDGTEAWTWKSHQLCNAADRVVRARSERYDDEEGVSWGEVHERLRAFFAALTPCS